MEELSAKEQVNSKRSFYEKEAINSGWSIREMKRQIAIKGVFLIAKYAVCQYAVLTFTECYAILISIFLMKR